METKAHGPRGFQGRIVPRELIERFGAMPETPPEFLERFGAAIHEHLTSDTTGTIVPLDRETRSVVSTEEAAYHLNRRPQTLRVWSCNGEGPIRPVRINGRLAWPVAEIRRVLGVAA